MGRRPFGHPALREPSRFAPAVSISTGHGRALYVGTASRGRAALKFSPTSRSYVSKR